MRFPPHLLRYAPLAAMATLGAGAVAVLGRIDPNTPGNPLPACPFYMLTGILCPGCGSTRCLHALVQLDLPQALAMNPLLVVSILPMLMMALHGAGLWPRALQPMLRPVARPMLWMGLIAGFWVTRNLPWYPFHLLAPG
ncbi:hypothetical protein ARC78_09450 [Stenotrophomonas pictorum JCM 9942]|jgi:hypothetical protein|uniref:DUF2752 domain-containing protein n=1 Tax=Stenotrophomonas pictorum JCM 9942 TaxID=1236960 RepID=A0A0R0ACT3_9GAMM|nr:DUF2752 domain-containing protein [Stenotrophomonas pictorum]KRG42169.1 hypothetical protein ARC78_09450 [Stenotrophomonas pictorum JCM 9942]